MFTRSNPKRVVLTDEILDCSLLKHQLLGLKIFGYFFPDSAVSWLHFLRGIFFSVSFLLFNISQYVDLVLVWGQVDVMMTNASTTIQFTTLLFRMQKFYLNRSKFYQLIRDVSFGVNEMLDHGTLDEVLIFKRNIRYSYWLAKNFTIMAIVTGHSIIFYTLLQAFYFSTPNPTPILRCWLPFDNLYLKYAIQIYMVCLGELLVPCWHTLMAGLMVYVIASFSVLSWQLEHLREYARRTGKNTDCEVEFLKTVVKQHNKVNQFVYDLEELIGGSVFFDFVVYSVLLCALLFQTSKATDNIQMFIGISYIMTMIVLQWMYYWHSNEISVHNNQISISIYLSDWYTCSLRFKKLLLLFTTMHTRPFQMKAILITMKLTVFIGILRASYSYFTLLQQFD